VGAIGWSPTSPLVRRGSRCGRTLRASLPFNELLPLRGLWARAASSGRLPGALQVSYLVDSASSHMLVSKIKPCMSKYKHFIL
jgi:hypothetical protein